MYWAHSDPNDLPPDAPGAHWQPLAEHLQNVARIARRLAELAAPANNHFHDLAEWSGLLHDYGKYTDCFQNMIREGKGKCPHSPHGAALAFTGAPPTIPGLRAAHIALAVAGHHAGIPDLTELPGKLKHFGPEALGLLDRASHDLPPLGHLLRSPSPKLEGEAGQFDLLTRMLLSCLVDADRLDTAGRPIIQAPLNPELRLNTLLKHLGELSCSNPEGTVKAARNQVLHDCLTAAARTESIFSLSVPTGGGKTLSAMAFALQRAALFPDRYRRVIVVIPYLSIIEQNAEVYAQVFGRDSVLEHHSGSLAKLVEADDKHFAPAQDDREAYQPPRKRPETENWDAAFIVTTSVRFFESLFSNHPSDLRRVHNVARSIVILDEVQVLPRHLLAPLLAMVDELCANWGCTFVLSTATKPAFERPALPGPKDQRWPMGRVSEIITAPAELHKRLRRVTIDWRIKDPVDWPEVAEWLRNERQALCVVNTRNHASLLYDQLSAPALPDTLFHLSTLMCPAHRLAIIGQIRERLAANLPCLVVSTQLIEAGVDLDFPVAFRAIGPLDSIVQVAGRTDREGKLTAAAGKPAGRVIVFTPNDNRMPPNEYETAAGIAAALATAHPDIQCDDLDVMFKFFDAYYGQADLGSALMELRRRFGFKSFAEQFEMISSRTQDIYVPFAEGTTLIDALFMQKFLDARLRAALQRFTVGLRPWEFREAQKRLLTEFPLGSNIWVAAGSSYDLKKGLVLSGDPQAILV